MKVISIIFLVFVFFINTATNGQDRLRLSGGSNLSTKRVEPSPESTSPEPLLHDVAESVGLIGSTFGAFVIPILGQAAQSGKADEKLEIMRLVASSYRFQLEGDRSSILKLSDDPAFRMGKQSADDVLDGAIFFWAGGEGRPEAALQVFQVKDKSPSGGHWVQEFISLSAGTFTAARAGKPSWSPREAGVTFHPVPGAPRPSATAALRSRQMRALAEEFRANDDFKDKGWSDLRLLTTPIARYGKAGSDVPDGALFAFALGTDPEAFLFIEARETSTGSEWHYAFAPMGCFAMKGFHRGKEVWSVSLKKDAYDPSKTYFVRLD